MVWRPDTGASSFGGSAFVMCGSSEAIITAVYHQQSGQVDIWLVETEENGQYGLVANLNDARPSIVSLFDRLRNAVTREGFDQSIRKP